VLALASFFLSLRLFFWGFVIVLEAKRSRKAERSNGVGGKEVWRKTAGDDLVPKQVCLHKILRLFFVLAFYSSGIYTSVLHMHKRMAQKRYIHQ